MHEKSIPVELVDEDGPKRLLAVLETSGLDLRNYELDCTDTQCGG